MADEIDDFEDRFSDDVDFQFELNNSADGLIITLVCASSRPLNPDEYAYALRTYVDRIETITSMTEIAGPLN